MTLYKDPEDVESLLHKLQDAETIDDVIKLTTNTYPDWIIGFIDDFSDDYPHIQRGWSNMCEKIGLKRNKIIIVDDIIFDTEHTFIIAISECLTRSGFMVRRKSEYIPCNVCKKAVPSYKSWKVMKDNSISGIPSTWKDTCTTCL